MADVDERGFMVWTHSMRIGICFRSTAPRRPVGNHHPAMPADANVEAEARRYNRSSTEAWASNGDVGAASSQVKTSCRGEQQRKGAQRAVSQSRENRSARETTALGHYGKKRTRQAFEQPERRDAQRPVSQSREFDWGKDLLGCSMRTKASERNRSRRSEVRGHKDNGHKRTCKVTSASERNRSRRSEVRGHNDNGHKRTCNAAG